jgi:hypothetical protein
MPYQSAKCFCNTDLVALAYTVTTDQPKAVCQQTTFGPAGDFSQLIPPLSSKTLVALPQTTTGKLSLQHPRARATIALTMASVRAGLVRSHGTAPKAQRLTPLRPSKTVRPFFSPGEAVMLAKRVEQRVLEPISIGAPVGTLVGVSVGTLVGESASCEMICMQILL